VGSGIKPLALIAALTVLASPVATVTAAENGVGEAMAVIDVASASGRIGDRQLAVGSQVFIGDRITTDATGEAQLLFDDGTRMVVGASASMVIDDFLFRGKAAENNFMVDSKVGAFRFISGAAGDSNYAIRTPTASISVEGTALDYSVATRGATRMVLLDGAAKMCGSGGDCQTSETQCEMLTAGIGPKVQRIAVGSILAREQLDFFPYIASQETLLEQFQVPGHGCDTAAGGLSEFALDEPGLRDTLRIAGGAAGAALLACILLGCDGGGGGGGFTVDTNNGTN
jgi:hypothetical protein